MEKRFLIVNWLIFTISIFLTGLFIQGQLDGESILINEAIAMFLFCVSILMKIYKARVGQYIIFCVLLMLLFNPLSYSRTITEGNTSTTYSEARFTSLISPLTFIILILFIAVNYSTVRHLYRHLIKGSEEEQVAKSTREVNFYYDKFNNCQIDELDGIFKMYNDYPIAAQIALERIKKEKDMI